MRRHNRRRWTLLRWSKWELVGIALIALLALLLPHPLPSPESLLAWLKEGLRNLPRRSP